MVLAHAEPRVRTQRDAKNVAICSRLARGEQQPAGAKAFQHAGYL